MPRSDKEETLTVKKMDHEYDTLDASITKLRHEMERYCLGVEDAWHECVMKFVRSGDCGILTQLRVTNYDAFYAMMTCQPMYCAMEETMRRLVRRKKYMENMR